jgi:hypothetical protein
VFVVQFILTHAIMPRVMSRELGINPLLVLLAVLLGARIYGLAGVLFAVPAAAIIATIIGKAVNRYLLPLYETHGWWMADVPLTTSDAEEIEEEEEKEIITPHITEPSPARAAAEPHHRPHASRADPSIQPGKPI